MISYTDDGPEDSQSLCAIVLISAIVGAMFHGVAMALRKHFGEGHEKYWLQWRWWIGVLSDAAAGLLTWPAMPLISVQLLMPLITVVQLITTYAIGLFVMREPPQLRNHVGAISSVAGIIGISISSSRVAADVAIMAFWSRCAQPHFLATLAFSLVLLRLSRTILGAWAFWALTGGLLEGVQYLCSRTLVNALYESRMVIGLTSEYLSVILTACLVCAVKGLCIISILHSQQLGMASNLSRFAGIYLVSATIFICALGAAMFGDNLELNPIFMASMFLTLAGIGLLSQEEPGLEGERSKLRPLTSEQKLNSAAAAAVCGGC
jgi:hypothetical protein